MAAEQRIPARAGDHTPRDEAQRAREQDSRDYAAAEADRQASSRRAPGLGY